MNEQMKTAAEFSDEPQAWQMFDAIIERSDAFRIYREVKGEYIQPRPETENKGARIDRILFPTQKVIDAGWKTGGAIGVEGKRSGVKAGPLICQALDYTRCLFRIEKNEGELVALIMPRWIFIYPVESSLGDLASVMGNNRIGTCSIQRGLVFHCNGTNAIEIREDGTVRAKDLVLGNKRGSR